MLVIREVHFIIVKGRWYVIFLLIWLVLLPAAALNVLAWRFEQKQIALNP